MLAFALAGGLVRAGGGARYSSDLVAPSIVTFLLGFTTLGPLLLLSQQLRGRDVALGLGEWLWLVHAGYWLCFAMITVVAIHNSAIHRVASLHRSLLAPLVMLTPPFAVAALVARRNAAKRGSPLPYSDLLGSIAFGILGLLGSVFVLFVLFFFQSPF